MGQVHHGHQIPHHAHHHMTRHAYTTREAHQTAGKVIYVQLRSVTRGLWLQCAAVLLLLGVLSERLLLLPQFISVGLDVVR